MQVEQPGHLGSGIDRSRCQQFQVGRCRSRLDLEVANRGDEPRLDVGLHLDIRPNRVEPPGDAVNLKSRRSQGSLDLPSPRLAQHAFKVGHVAHLQVFVSHPLRERSVIIVVELQLFLDIGHPLGRLLEASQQSRGTLIRIGILPVERDMNRPILDGFLFQTHLEELVAGPDGIGRVVPEFQLSLLHPGPCGAGECGGHRRVPVCGDQQPPPVVTAGSLRSERQQVFGSGLHVLRLAVIGRGFQPPGGDLIVLREPRSVLGVDSHILAALVPWRVMAEPLGLRLQQCPRGVVAQRIEGRGLQHLIPNRLAGPVLIVSLIDPRGHHGIGVRRLQ